MRGQRLFIRPIESDDRPAIAAFLTSNDRSGDVPACGLLGKLVGDLVAVLAIEITADAVRIEDLTVGRDLRRKHIGRSMLDELDRFARKIERTRVVVADPGPARDFFRRVGFVEQEQLMVRKVT